MTKEDKELLLKDLCARLLYGVVVHIHDINVDDYDRQLIPEDIDFIQLNRRDCKPYLRPMSSMTEEEKRELYNWLIEFDGNWFDFNKLINKLTFDKILIAFDNSWLLCDWLNKKQFDYHGLIPKGLAIEVTKENNPYLI